MTLPDYPITYEEPFTIQIDECVVTLFEQTQPIQDIEYIIGSQADLAGIIPFTMEPDCGYEIEYFVNEVTGSNSLRELPSFVNFLEPDEIEILSNDDTDAGEYII